MFDIGLCIADFQYSVGTSDIPCYRTHCERNRDMMLTTICDDDQNGF